MNTWPLWARRDGWSVAAETRQKADGCLRWPPWPLDCPLSLSVPRAFWRSKSSTWEVLVGHKALTAVTKNSGPFLDVILLDVATGKTTTKSKTGLPVFGWSRDPSGQR